MTVLIAIVIKRTHLPTRVVRVQCICNHCPHPQTPLHLQDTIADSGVMVYGWLVITPCLIPSPQFGVKAQFLTFIYLPKNMLYKVGL